MSRQKGHALLLALVLLTLAGLILNATGESEQFSHQLKQEQMTRQSQVLEHIKAGLIGFAASQGIHSQSHLGHLPCPADQPEQPPKTSCLNKPWGYLPTQSRVAVNYLNRGLDSQVNHQALSAQQDWHYAVSAQLLQPNALGWSRWVDYAQPAIQVRIQAEDNRVVENLAAVVAARIEALAEHHYDVSPPYLLISTPELQHHMEQAQSRMMEDTVRTWLHSAGHTGSEPPASHENLLGPDAGQTHFRPQHSACSCRCTRTRCTCQCDQAARWISTGSCFDSNPSCVEEAAHSECESNDETTCVMSGPVRLKSGWPVSRFEPVASANKACRPASRNECPLSVEPSACICDFSWPDSTLTELGAFQVFISQKGSVRAVKGRP